MTISVIALGLVDERTFGDLLGNLGEANDNAGNCLSEASFAGKVSKP